MRATATAAWLNGLAPGTRAALRALQHVDRPRSAIILFFFALWMVPWAAVAHWPIWPVRLPAYLLMGAALHGLGILMHEAVHGNLFRERRRDRWAAFLLGAPVLVSGAAYRVSHLRHHRHNRGPEDPDEFASHFKGVRAQAIAFYVWAAIGMLIFLGHVPLTALVRGTRRERREVVLEYTVILGLAAVILLWAREAGRLDLLLHGWVAPMGVAWIIVNVRGWSEHMLTSSDHPLHATRTITSNRVVSLLMCNLNYHLEHHLLPAVPWYNLPRVHALLQEEFCIAGAPVCRSYMRFIWEAARRGFHGRIPAPEKGEA